MRGIMKPMEKTVRIKSEKDTERFGLALGQALQKGHIVALIGDLGTGKTALTGYIARGLGISDAITSPTFTIVAEHDGGRLKLYHFDVYRVSDPDELYEIGLDEYLFGEGVCVIEWADLIEDLLPEGTIYIRMEYGAGPEERIYHAEGLPEGVLE